MIKKIFLITFLITLSFSYEKVKKIDFGKIYKTSAKVEVFKNQTQNIVAQIPGHIEKYFVKEGDSVKKGEKIAKVKSFYITELSSNYLKLKKEIEVLEKRLKNAKELYKKGLITLNDLNNIKIKLQSLNSKLSSIKLKLKILGIKDIKKPIEYFYITSHADGVIQKILTPLHSNIESSTPVVKIVNQKNYYAIAYLNVDDALKLNNVKAFFKLSDFIYDTEFIKVMPQVDSETFQAKLLFHIKPSNKPLLIGAFGDMVIESSPYKKALAVKKSALTMLNGDFVVFVPKEGEEHKKENVEHKHNEHEEEGEEHEHEELNFEPRVVKVVEFLKDFAVVEGLEENQEYIDKDVYFYKSRLLKNSLGEHGH
ncbi:efflux RND transporter periplasmic adaptor subunit [Nitrosophilus kaiyonis]|uniref:efflux RND transporter periplasmic adaptor subunit n=1 Tax=Nitrosophilus kaiyonis TaxID=2930200 RepID=UPI0024906913|nr:efflux RND transporter periplasmic adaptor subunit [Nitrosophilus kaiyonis]